MAKDVLITPASGIIEFYETAGNLEASIELDNSNNLIITGNITLGDAGGDVYIGDGVSAANIVFEQGGAVYALATKTLTLGIANSFLSLAANITSGANVTGNITTGNILTDGYFFANGTPFTSGGTPGGSNTQVQFNDGGSFGATAGLTFNKATNALSTTGTVTATGNITGGNITTAGRVAATGNITGGNVAGTTGAFTTVTGAGSGITALNATNISSGTLAQARLANASVTLGSTALTLGATVTTVAGLSSVTSTTFVGALTGAATTAGTVTTAAQPNITSVGTLTSVTVTGNVTGGNINTGARVVATGNVTGGNLTTAGRVDATGNITGGNILGNGAGLTGINVFSNISVSGGNSVVADSISDTLTLVAGDGITITANATSDTITFSTSGGNASIFETGGDMGLVTESPTSSEDLGLVTDAVTESYDLGSLGVDGVVANENLVNGTITGNKFAADLELITTGNITANNATITTSLAVGNTAPSGTEGEIRATGNITAFYSDLRLKKDIRPIDDALLRIDTITGVFYTQNETAEQYGYRDYGEQVGVIAQEVQKVLPHVVRPAPFDIDVDGSSRSGENYLTVQYEKIIPLLIQGIKELHAEIETLKQQIGNRHAGNIDV